MSINISSEEEEPSGDELPGIDIFGVTVKAQQAPRSHSSSTIELDPSKYNKENVDDCVDLTQEDICVEDEAVALSGSSGRSLREVDGWDTVGRTGRQRSVSLHSDSTIELADNDAIFDEMVIPKAVKQSDSVVSSLASGSVSGSSGYSTGSSEAVSSASSSSGSKGTGVGRGGAKRRKSVGSLEDKSRKKTAAAERVSKKKKLAEERAAKQLANEMNKVYKPGECMKYMNIELHPSLQSAWYMSDLAREASAAGVRVTSSPDMFHEGLVMWSRRTQQTLGANGGQLELSRPNEPCDRALLVQCIEDIAVHVSEHTLSTHVGQIRDIVGCRVSLLVFVKDYFRASGRKKQTGTEITEIELEMAFTDLLVTADCDAAVVNTPNELALIIVQFTKAIAEAPYKKAKKACDEQAEFYMRGDNKKCVAVHKDGHGLSRLWQQMIAVLPLSSLETSRAVCTRYKSPLELYEALQQSNSVNDLADIGVDRAGVPGARARRVGPEFARKLQTLFTADDGDMLIH